MIFNGDHMAEETSLDKKIEIPAAYRKLNVIEQVGIGTWGNILNATGEDEHFRDHGLTKQTLSKYILDSKGVSNQLVFALKVVFELGDYAGRNLFQQAADDISVDLQTSDNESNRELAARVWLLSRTHNQYLNILNRALADYEYSQKSNSVREYAGESGFKVEEIDEEVIKNKVTEWCQENRKNGVAQLNVLEKGGIYWCYIYRGEPLKRQPVITDDNRRDQLSFRPEACDLVRIDPETGRIGIVTRSDKLRDVYKNVLGEVLTGNAGYFSGENICTLEPIQKYGKKVFEGNPHISFHTIRVTELKWTRGGRDTIIVRGKNCLKTLEDLKINFKTGVLVEAKLAFESYGVGRPSRVTIKVPNRIDVQHDENEDVVNRYLTTIGIRGRFDSDFEEKDFWSLFPWEYSQTDWRHQIAGDFDILRKKECLKAIDLHTVRHPNHSSGPGDMSVELIGNGEFIGVSDDPEIGVRTLTATDREGYKLDIQKITSLISSSLSLGGECKAISSEIISLGGRSISASTKIQMFLAISEPTTDASILINHHSSGAKPVLIIPSNCFYNGNIPYVLANITSLYFDELFSDVIKILGIQDEVPAREWNFHDLIVDLRKNRIWYKDIELEKVNFNEHAYKLALEIAKKNGDIVPTVYLNELLSNNIPGSYGEKLAHRAKSKFMEKINVALTANGSEKCKPSDIFSPKGGGYTLNCSACVIE